MKAKITLKTALFLLICIMVICCTMSFGFAADSSACTHPNLTEEAWTVVRETTCAMSGLKTQWCYDCAKEVEREIPLDPNAHVPGPWTVETPRVTCKEDGLEVVYCQNGCTHKTGPDAGKKIVIAYRDIPAHDESILFQEKATCQTAGYQLIACLTCYQMRTVEVPVDTVYGHQYTPWQVVEEATCVKESGIEKCYCLVDGCKSAPTRRYENKDNHTEIVWNYSGQKEPTCSAPGYVLGECQGCHSIVKREYPRHSFTEYTVLENKTVKPTCNDTGKEVRRCACGYEYEIVLEIDEDNHVYSDWVTEKEASCTEGKRYKYCIYHFEEKIEQATPANGEHNFGEWVSYIEPDCSKTGLDKRECADCSAVETRTLPTKHDFATWETVVAMSCDESSLQVGSKLAKCNECSYEKYFTIPAVHTYSDWIIISDTSCKRGDSVGEMQRKCQFCDATETKTFKVDHNFTEWFVTEKPICATGSGKGREGVSTRWCKDCSAYEQKSIPAKHDYVEVEVIAYPSSKDGVAVPGKRIVECTYCNDVISEDEFDCEHICKEWTVTGIDAKKHDIRTATCVACKATVTEVVHSYSEWSGFKCGIMEGEMTRTCIKCSATETKAMDENHPNADKYTVEPTCSSSGHTKVNYCPDCGVKNEICDIVPVLGHDLDAEWTPKLQATCTSQGTIYKACSRCDYLEFEKVDKTQHVLIVLEEGVEPTCTTSGLSPKNYCGVCKAIFEQTVIPATDHVFVDGGDNCSICGAYRGTDCVCDCHSTSGMGKIIFSVVNKFCQLIGIKQVCSCGVLHYDEVGFIGKLLGLA